MRNAGFLLILSILAVAGCGIDAEISLRYNHQFNPQENSEEIPQPVWAPPFHERLDTSFNDTGVFYLRNSSGETSRDQLTAIAVDSGNNYYGTGSIAIAGLVYDMVLVKVRADGTLDPGFGNGGIVTNGGLPFQTAGADVCLTNEGKILVADLHRFYIWQYNQDGTLDTDFATGGIFHYYKPDTNGIASVAIGPDGMITLAGYSPWGLVICRLQADGSPVLAFNGTGVREYLTAEANVKWANDSITDSNGRILVAGSILNDSRKRDIAVWRFNPDSSPDLSWGIDGVAFYQDDPEMNGGGACLVEHNGKIVVGGSLQFWDDDFDCVIWRLNENGSPDVSFGDNGLVHHHNAAGGEGWDSGYCMTIDFEDRIILAGSSLGENGEEMTIWRFNWDGSLDQAFDYDGYLTYDFSNGAPFTEYLGGITLDSLNRIVVCGGAEDSEGRYGMLFARFLP